MKHSINKNNIIIQRNYIFRREARTSTLYQGRSDGGYIGIYTPQIKLSRQFFYVVVLSPCND